MCIDLFISCFVFCCKSRLARFRCCAWLRCFRCCTWLGALKDLAGKLEDLCAVHQGAWHVFSILLLAIFMSDCNCNGSNWKNWWDMCNRILETWVFRAFDIVLLMLQQMRELSGNHKINDLKVWTQELVHLVKQKLIEWSNFPEEKVLESLEGYGVSLR